MRSACQRRGALKESAAALLHCGMSLLLPSARAAILGSVAGFLALELPAMALYPGGTWFDATTRGYRFWENFLCDLEWRVALNGQANQGAPLAQAAMLVLVLGLAPFWIVVPRLLRERARLGAAVRVLGLVAAAGTVAVALMPSDRFGRLHGAAVILSGLPGLTAAGLAVVGLLFARPRPRAEGWIGASMLVFALINFVLYASHFLFGVEGTPLVPAAQKLALGLLLTWMVSVALHREGGVVMTKRG